jgi:hypothetical protein
MITEFEFDRQPQGKTQNAKPTVLMLKPTAKGPSAIYVVGQAFLARFILVWGSLTGTYYLSSPPQILLLPRSPLESGGLIWSMAAVYVALHLLQITVQQL